jgi:hypothetical protein
MRTVLVLAFICACYIAVAQQKPTLQVVLEFNGTSARAENRVNQTSMYLLIDTPNQVYRRYTLTQTYRAGKTLKPGFTAGFTFNKPINKNLSIRAGLVGSVYAINSIGTVVQTTFDTSMTSIPAGARVIYSRMFGVIWKTAMKTHVIQVDVPLGISVSPGESKWRMEADLVPSFILSSALNVYYNDSKTGEKLPDNTRTVNFAAGIGVAYSIFKDWEIGLRYRHGLTNILNSPYPETRVQSVGLRLKYTLPALFASRK